MLNPANLKVVIILAVPLLVFLFGAAIGSFVNVLVRRYGSEKITGRSCCPACHHPLLIPDLIPLLSFIFLRGRCRHCRQTISAQYPIVELSLGLLALIIFLPLPVDLISLAGLVFQFIIAALLVTLFLIDLRTMLLPDIYIVLLSIVVIAHQLLVTIYQLPVTNYQLLFTSAFGALLGTGFLALLWLATRGRGIGLGDLKLMLPLGALFGVSGTALLLFLAFTSGGLVASLLLASRRVTLKTAVPFGPFLCAAAIFLLIIPTLPASFLTWLLF